MRRDLSGKINVIHWLLALPLMKSIVSGLSHTRRRCLIRARSSSSVLSLSCLANATAPTIEQTRRRDTEFGRAFAAPPSTSAFRRCEWYLNSLQFSLMLSFALRSKWKGNESGGLSCHSFGAGRLLSVLSRWWEREGSEEG